MLTRNDKAQAIKYAMQFELGEFREPCFGFEWFCEKLLNRAKPGFRRALLKFYRNLCPMTQRTYLEILYRLEGAPLAHQKRRKSLLMNLLEAVRAK